MKNILQTARAILTTHLWGDRHAEPCSFVESWPFILSATAAVVIILILRVG